MPGPASASNGSKDCRISHHHGGNWPRGRNPSHEDKISETSATRAKRPMSCVVFGVVPCGPSRAMQQAGGEQKSRAPPTQQSCKFKKPNRDYAVGRFCLRDPNYLSCQMTILTKSAATRMIGYTV